MPLLPMMSHPLSQLLVLIHIAIRLCQEALGYQAPKLVYQGSCTAADLYGPESLARLVNASHQQIKSGASRLWFNS
jgi:hypothetical protein